MAITPATSAAPPWSGVKFTCSQCTAEWQLEAADRCEFVYAFPDAPTRFVAPPCPTPGCGYVNVIELRVDEPTQEGNAS
jgi:hypothetical protein